MKKTERQSDSPPLFGKTVIVTRARAQAADLTNELEQQGATVIHCPTIETIPPTDVEPLDAAIAHLEEYDWVVFTSANGVDFFFRRLYEQRKDGVGSLRRISICTIGPATTRALELNGVRTTLCASESKGEGVLKELIDYVGGPSGVLGRRFLIPRAKVARDVLPSGLRRCGAKVDSVEAYQTVAPKIDLTGVVRLFEKQSIDAITFTSSSTVSNFAALVGSKDLSTLLGKTVVACIGPVTAKTAGRFGLSKIIQPEIYNAHELVRCIVKAFDQPARDPS